LSSLEEFFRPYPDSRAEEEHYYLEFVELLNKLRKNPWIYQLIEHPDGSILIQTEASLRKFEEFYAGEAMKNI